LRGRSAANALLESKPKSAAAKKADEHVRISIPLRKMTHFIALVRGISMVGFIKPALKFDGFIRGVASW
jgi:hypothetical protein